MCGKSEFITGMHNNEKIVTVLLILTIIIKKIVFKVPLPARKENRLCYH